MMYGEELHILNSAIAEAALATAAQLEATGVVLLTPPREVPGMVVYFGYRPTVSFDYDTLTTKGVLKLYRYTKKIQSAVLGNAAGAGYAVGDILSVTQTGASGGKVRVTGVNAGAVTTVEPVKDQGTGIPVGFNYSAASNLATVALTGSGNNAFTVTISDKLEVGSINLEDDSVAGLMYLTRASNAIEDASPTPPPPASYAAGEKLALEVATQAAGGGYLAGDYAPIIIVQNRGENLLTQEQVVIV